MVLKTDFGVYEDCYLDKSFYLIDGTPSISIWSEKEGPIVTLTKCLGTFLVSDNEQFIDINNCPWAADFIKQYGLGEPTGISQMSGFCEYPLYRFDMDTVRKYAK